MGGKLLRWRGVSVWCIVSLMAGTMLAGNTFARSRRAGPPKRKKKKRKTIRRTKKKEKKGLPLKPDRKIEFTTDEGTWLSLDVSPDGKTIVFELLGDIYTLPIEGGEAKLIDGGMAFDSQPRFSPDGKWIAFISDREGSENIWIMHPDGTEAKQVSKDPNNDFASPNWSPDGKYIFVSKAGFGITTYEIWMYHVDGGTGIQITKAKPTPTTPRKERPNAMGVVASPDGKYLYYAMRKGPFSYNAQFPNGSSCGAIARPAMKTVSSSNWRALSAPSFRPTAPSFCTSRATKPKASCACAT